MSQAEMITIKEINLSEDESQLLLSIIPVNATVLKEHIVYLLQHRSFPRFKLNLEGIDEAVQALASMQDTFSTGGALQTIAIADKENATLSVTIEQNEMIAYAEITTAHGGNDITLSQIKEQCDELEIKFGLLPQAMLALLSTCKKSPSGKSFRVTIAKGLDIVDGEDSTFEKLVDTDNHRTPEPKVLDNGKVDMLDLGQNITVEPGTLLMKKTPATQGSPGKTITGNIVEQKKGTDIDFVITDNVHVSPNNPLHLIAKTRGIPIDDEGFVRIDDVLILNQVDVKSGNIDYQGTVVVTGDIQEGMRLNATGDITVMGLIESAIVTCDGDLTVKMPIIGHQKENEAEFSCEIDCKGNLQGTIAQYTKLAVGKDLMMSNQLVHCQTDCEGSVMVHNEFLTTGSIIGGVTSANGSVLTTIVGTSAGNKTVINLLGNYKTLTLDQKAYTNELQQTHDALSKVKQAESRAGGLLDQEESKQAKIKLAADKQRYRDQSDDIQSKLFDIKLKIKNYFLTTQLTATKTLYSDSNICIGNQNKTSSKTLGPTVVSIIDDSIELSPYVKK